ncbi:hypothetical protein QBC42DRAFT_238461 [Cladorrhinum samala]|uniref:Transcription elongation factor S-II n=1 Tax=Cladorrhinum samala TaxID=585594 RepID=A0AAV9H7H3_9PEZI|nr:hypothetical protein QBC42DRAFT_238461 [Cladorrhinum samala]
MSHRDSLLQAATLFCQSFASKRPPDEIFSHFTSTESNISVFEHGLPRLAPFLGREFRGREGLERYFKTISECLTYEDMRFSNYVVDVEMRKVSVRGEARFTWSSTGQSWDEVFTYVLAFDVEGKVVKYEVWADSGAAYLASQGKLT